MTDLTKVKFAKILFSARFWVATMVLYLTSRDISTAHVFQLIGFYYVMSVLLEYPTGVIGDYYSHRISVFSGYLILAMSYILLSFSGSILFYGLTLFLLALGGSLVSGSDNALLHTVSKDFKKDFAQVKSYGIVVTFLAVSIGGFVSAIDLRIPLYLTAIFLVIASFVVISTKIRVRGKTENNNLIGVGIEGLRYSVSNKQLLNIMVVSALIGAFFFSFKWLYNPLFLSLELNVASWGVLAGIATLLIALGVRIYGKYSKSNVIIATLILLVSILSIGITSMPIIALAGMFVSHLMRGYFETKLMVDMNAVITKSVRSSVLSLNSLLIRAGATAFMFTGGIILDKFSMMVLMATSVAVFLIIGLYSLIKIRKFEFQRS
jgi:MFS family permease